tara:strand:+ start:224 stop:1111 length:888 start_codon:yes stop_codon:yes gene_type:complete
VHILTKIFIVLVTLLAVAIVPLVATYTTNENTYRSKFRSADDQQRVAMIRASDAETALFSQRVQMQNEIDTRDANIGKLIGEQSNTRSSLSSLKAQIGRLQANLSQSNANLQALSSASEVNSELKQRFVVENYTLRQNVIDAERMIMDMEDTLEDARMEAQGAMRAEQKAIEERHEMEKEIDTIRSKLASYVSKFGELEALATVITGTAPDRSLSSTVLTVSRDGGEVLVEINSGSRDGVQEGWIMTVGQNGTFLGRLQIEEVDINRSIGRISLEDPSRGLVMPGSSVYAVKGRN